MVIKGIIKKGAYFDSVSLMMIAKQVNELEGILDSTVVMGTYENKSILKSAGLLIPEFEDTDDTDLLIVVKAENSRVADDAMERINKLLVEKKSPGKEKEDYIPKSFEGALKLMPDANLSLISVAGRYAYDEAMKALKKNLHVMIFSDNVPLEKEIELKKFAREKDLLVMGPDCGTAIINGAPLGFANIVAKGDIGIVGASGTGIQEVSSIISNEGCGISQAIGTGGRDVKKDVGGVMFLLGLKALTEDENTKIIVLVSKPPHEDVMKSIAEEIKNIDKPVVAIFLGGNPEILKDANVNPAQTLEEAALMAVSISKGIDPDSFKNSLKERELQIHKAAEEEAGRKASTQKYIRGLFSGGTLCDEAQLIFKDLIGHVYSNAPLDPGYKLEDSWKSKEHAVVDYGEDEFTVGRPHPMIDYSLRNRKILEEAQSRDTAVILLDVVLGYGSNMKPAEELAPVIKEAVETAEKDNRQLSVICSITGTDKDPQNRKFVEQSLKEGGVIVMPSNAAACRLAGLIAKKLEDK